jgi:tellurite resistance protein
MATGTAATELSLASLEMDKLSACIELMFLAAYADGVVDASERDAFEKLAAEVTRGQLRAEVVRAVLSHFEGRAVVPDRDARVRDIAARLPDPRMRRAVFSLAADIAKADGKLTAEEQSFLSEVGAAFELPQEEIAKIAA